MLKSAEEYIKDLHWELVTRLASTAAAYDALLAEHAKCPQPEPEPESE